MKGRVLSKVLMFMALFAFWVLLSGYFDAFHLIAGIICAGAVTIMSHELFVPKKGHQVLRKTARFILFIPWLLFEVLLGGLDVAYRVLHPALPIDPSIVIVETSLQSDLAQTTLANAIMLAPGTATIDVEGGRYVVHALTPEFASALTTTDDVTIQERVAAIYEEDA